MKKYFVAFLISMATLVGLLSLAYYTGMVIDSALRGTIAIFGGVFVFWRVIRYNELRSKGLTKYAAFYTAVTMIWSTQAKIMRDFHKKGVKEEDYQTEYEKQEFIQRIKQQRKENQ